MANLRSSLDDLTTRQEQLERHLLRSADYLHQLDQQLKRYLTFIYLGITLMLFYLLVFAYRSLLSLPMEALCLIGVTSFLSIISCFLLIRTKTALHRLNLNFLNEQEKSTLHSLRQQRQEVENRLSQEVVADLV